uniref:Orphan protein n=1 Tax=Mesocestoides corti TaxID=53468 RepID=A0A5K3FMH0_MESCO
MYFCLCIMKKKLFAITQACQLYQSKLAHSQLIKCSRKALMHVSIEQLKSYLLRKIVNQRNK